MFCGNCGANNPDDASVCGSCGAALTPAESAAETPAESAGETPAAAGAPAGGRNKAIGLAVVAVGVVAAIAVVVWVISMLVGGGGPEDAAADFVKAGYSAKGGKTMVSLMPPAMVEEALDRSDDYDTKAELIQEINDYLEDAVDDYEDYYGKYKVKIEVRDVDEWKNSEIKDYNERLDDSDVNMQIKDGADVELKVTIDGKDDKDSSKLTIPVVKVGGKWYIDLLNYDYLLY